jgi:Mg/Co/Ni transporter MgtE
MDLVPLFASSCKRHPAEEVGNIVDIVNDSDWRQVGLAAKGDVRLLR